MKKLFAKYQSVIKFILTFLLVYFVLSFAYKFYLQWSTGERFYPDYFTYIVAQQSADLLHDLDYRVQVIPHPDEASLKLIINEKYVARIIEGCNSASVIILFISFIIAFSGDFKITFLYILAGSVLIYIANLFRVVILAVGLYHYPWRKDILHTVIFPGIIYGMVCLLWVLWVNRFSNIKRVK
ncbi:exosortase family protein XrtF [Hanstruepera neustonica]|uniref:Exosortase family protein XrtF n=1 Tax=Hanstruepera neustonica TaxID=1445657 RepID=A0A2K1E0U1_9FLAO|nr:exosortase family protein XrtF [Hanstruepera neustonica]PNQ73881.1 exosortase family protein XrtF [Hanstruepera neustonica]